MLALSMLSVPAVASAGAGSGSRFNGDGDSIQNYPITGYQAKMDPSIYRTFDQNYERYKIHSMMPGDPLSN